ncbi:MAG: response regulator [Bryobacteraceae bacterium]
MKPRIILADDHQIVLDGLRSLLSAEFDILATTSDGRQLVDLAKTLDPDAIVADISMPLLNGIEAARQLRQSGSRAKFVFLTMHPDPSYLIRALRAGAQGYVLKHAASEELTGAIRQVLQNRLYISPGLRTATVDEMLDDTKVHLRESLELTPRQREVLQLLAEGKSAKEIGGILEISSRTVETHKYKMMDDLGVKTSAELIQHAIKEGLVTP